MYMHVYMNGCISSRVLYTKCSLRAALLHALRGLFSQLFCNFQCE